MTANLSDCTDDANSLHEAASDESAAAIRALIAAGADVNAKDERGRTPLHLAALNGNADAVETLIAAGADVNAKDGRGKTPLHLAAEMGHAKTEKALNGGCDDGGCGNSGCADGEFWVYENDPANRARVHKGDCKYCNHGEGIHGGGGSNSRWHGPFATIEEACDKMRCLDKKDSGECGECKPCSART